MPGKTDADTSDVHMILYAILRIMARQDAEKRLSLAIGNCRARHNAKFLCENLECLTTIGPDRRKNSSIGAPYSGILLRKARWCWSFVFIANRVQLPQAVRKNLLCA
jgi:hypothetical protein